MKAEELEARRALVATALLEHRSQRAIATELRIPLTNVNRDIKAIRAAWRTQQAEAIEELVAEDLQRFTAVETILWPLVLSADLQAIDRWVKVRQERARMLGTDAPTRFDGKLVVDDSALQMIGEIIGRAVTDQETLDRIRAEFARLPADWTPYSHVTRVA